MPAHLLYCRAAFLKGHADMDPSMTCRCTLSEFHPHGVVLHIKTTLRRSTAAALPRVRSEVLREAEAIARAHGAPLAMVEPINMVSYS